MVTPADYAKEVYGKVKQTLYPDPKISEEAARNATEKAETDFRTFNYNKPVEKPKPIKLKLSPKPVTSKVDVGGKR
jgi:hypothetical protein